MIVALNLAAVTVSTQPTVSITGHALETDPAAFAQLTASAFKIGAKGLRRRMADDGYVYLPGFFRRYDVMATRAEIVRRLYLSDVLEPRTDPMDAVARPGVSVRLGRDNCLLAAGNRPLIDLLFRGRMIQFFEVLLGGSVLFFNHTWVRVSAPNHGTEVHTDMVFMGRGTTNLYTAWVPYGDIPLELGGLSILENSHRQDAIRDGYCTQDVDSFCENKGEQPVDWYEQWKRDPKAHYMKGNFVLADDAADLRRDLGGRWLTANYRAGDLLVFGMYTVHAAIDNRTNSFRLSSDTRYQLASDPVDDRWAGELPVGHTVAGKRGMIC